MSPILKPTYISRKLTNGEDLVTWAKENGIPEVLDADDMHTTLAYSKAPLDWSKITLVTEPLVVRFDKRELLLLGDEKEATVLGFQSYAMKQEWQTILDLGGSWDWDDFTSHVTLSYNGGGSLPEGLKAYTGSLHFGPQIMKEIEEDWGKDK